MPLPLHLLCLLRAEMFYILEMRRLVAKVGAVLYCTVPAVPCCAAAMAENASADGAWSILAQCAAVVEQPASQHPRGQLLLSPGAASAGHCQ